MSGSWDLKQHLDSDEIARAAGSIQMEDKRVEDFTYTAGEMSGTACALMLRFGTYTVVSCTSTLVGNCMGEAPPPHPNATLGLGAPSSVTPGHVTWTFSYATSDAAVVKATITLQVAGPAH